MKALQETDVVVFPKAFQPLLIVVISECFPCKVGGSSKAPKLCSCSPIKPAASCTVALQCLGQDWKGASSQLFFLHRRPVVTALPGCGFCSPDLAPVSEFLITPVSTLTVRVYCQLAKSLVTENHGRTYFNHIGLLVNCHLINKTRVPVGLQTSFEISDNSSSFVFHTVSLAIYGCFL